MALIFWRIAALLLRVVLRVRPVFLVLGGSYLVGFLLGFFRTSG